MVEEDEDEGESVRVRLYDFTGISLRLTMRQTIHKKSEMLFVRGKHNSLYRASLAYNTLSMRRKQLLTSPLGDSVVLISPQASS